MLGAHFSTNVYYWHFLLCSYSLISSRLLLLLFLLVFCLYFNSCSFNLLLKFLNFLQILFSCADTVCKNILSNCVHVSHTLLKLFFTIFLCPPCFQQIERLLLAFSVVLLFFVIFSFVIIAVFACVLPFIEIAQDEFSLAAYVLSNNSLDLFAFVLK